MSTQSHKQTYLLLASVFIVASCGLVYELLAAALSSYLIGNSVMQFSIVIGVFMFAMGIGSYLSRYITDHPLTYFVALELVLGTIGGSAWLLLFSVFAFSQAFTPLLIATTLVIGALVGVEIPLVIRILKQNEGFREMISTVMALDYVGALAASLLFPLFFLPHIGLVRTGFLFGLLNIIVAGVAIYRLPGKIQRPVLMRNAAILAGALQIGGVITAGGTTRLIEDHLYQDQILIAEDSLYQRIVVTRWRDDIRLYLNGNLQFSTTDEARYHESLVHPAMSQTPGAKRVLLLGGGDGMAAREVLKYPGVNHIDLVDLDPVITKLFSEHPLLGDLNDGALQDPKVTVRNADAVKFLEETNDSWDVILIDLPDPSTPTLARLYSKSFYRLALKHLSQNGSMTTQATSPYYATNAFWCIVETIEAGGRSATKQPLSVTPYHVNVPSFGEWGFVLAKRQTLIAASVSGPTDTPKISVATRFLNDATAQSLFQFPLDISRRPTEVNRLDRPVLVDYYEQGWKSYND